MKKRYLYSLLFAVPGFFISAIISFVAFGSAAGFLWLYVYGDMSWPSSVEIILPIIFAFTFLLLWIISIVIGFVTGKKFEKDQTQNVKHILISLGMTIVPIILIVLHQLSVGNIGQKTDGMLCNEYCSQNGYSGSGMPPRNSGDRSCFCYDNSGNEVIKGPIDSLIPSK